MRDIHLNMVTLINVMTQELHEPSAHNDEQKYTGRGVAGVEAITQAQDWQLLQRLQQAEFSFPVCGTEANVYNHSSNSVGKPVTSGLQTLSYVSQLMQSQQCDASLLWSQQ